MKKALSVLDRIATELATAHRKVAAAHRMLAPLQAKVESTRSTLRENTEMLGLAKALADKAEVESWGSKVFRAEQALELAELELRTDPSNDDLRNALADIERLTRQDETVRAEQARRLEERRAQEAIAARPLVHRPFAALLAA